MGNNYSNDDSKVLDFVALRLLNYSRINYEFLLEAIEGKFPATNADILLKEALLDTSIAEISREHITLKDRETLVKFHAQLD